jgi:hypothetical protein
MSNKESRRIVPVSAFAIAAFAVLVVFEVLVIGGVLELKASTVARIAPWAYEPFLRLVGEHPESAMLRETNRSREETRTNKASGISSVAGFNPDALTLELDAEAATGEPSEPEQALSTEQQPVTNPDEPKQTNQIPDRPKAVVPVG